MMVLAAVVVVVVVETALVVALEGLGRTELLEG